MSISITPQSLKDKKKILKDAETEQHNAQQELNIQDKPWQKWAVKKRGDPPPRADKKYFDRLETAKKAVDKAKTDVAAELKKTTDAKSELDRVKDEVKTSTGGSWTWYKNKPLGSDAYIMYFVKKIVFNGGTWKAVAHIHSKSFGAAPAATAKFVYNANDKADLIAPGARFEFGKTPKMEGLGSTIKNQIGDITTHNTWANRDDGPNDDNYAKYVDEMFNIYDADLVNSDSYGLQNGYGSYNSYQAVEDGYYPPINHIDNNAAMLGVLVFTNVMLMFIIILCCFGFAVAVGAGIGYHAHKKVVRHSVKPASNEQV